MAKFPDILRAPVKISSDIRRRTGKAPITLAGVPRGECRPCQWCGTSIGIRTVDIHEIKCEGNPINVSRRREAQGVIVKRIGHKKIVRKAPVPLNTAPPIRLVQFLFPWEEGRIYKLTMDDAFVLLQKGAIIRVSKYSSNKYTVRNDVGEAVLETVWEYIERAQKLGAGP